MPAPTPPETDPQPLSEAVYFILASLATAPGEQAEMNPGGEPNLATGGLHGYAILKTVEEMSAGRLVLSTGTLYGALRRLLEAGWIERVAERAEEEGASGRERKVYRLTFQGQRVFLNEVERLRGLLRLARGFATGGAEG